MKNKIVTIVGAVCAVAVAGVGGYVFCTQINIPDAKLYALIPVYIILLFFGAFVDEIIHEGAHLLLGVMCSMGVKIPKIRLFKSSSVEVYPKGAKNMKARMIVTAGAGLFFDLLIIAFGIISLCVKSVPIIFCVTLPYAIYTFIVNVAPLEYAAGKTDGLMLWELISNKPTAQVLLAILRIQGTVHAGVPIQDLPEENFFSVPQLPEDDLNFIILTQLRFEYYEAKGDDNKAYKYLARYKDLIQYLPEEYKK